MIVSTLARVFTPHDAVLVNQKLRGYWVVTENHTENLNFSDSILVVKFYKCSSTQRKNQLCKYSWSVLDSSVIEKFKLLKEVKQSWIPEVTKNYWVEKKKDKKTKREIIHIEGFDEISIDLIKKEIEFYSKDSMMLRIRKLK